MKIIISKYEKYPFDNPVGQAVGFTIFINDRSFYIDTIINKDEIADKIEDEILVLAWDILKEQVQLKVDELSVLPPLVGSEWSPPVEDEELEELEVIQNVTNSMVSP